VVDTFAQALQPWHDFFTLMGSSAAALLGLLFVSASIHLDALTGDARSLAYDTFNQFFLVFLLAAICLVPGLSPATFGLAVLLVGVLGATTQLRRRLRRRQLGFPHPWRRDVFPALAFILLLITSSAIWTTGTPVMPAVFAASLLLISQATQQAWEMLVYLGTAGHPISPSDT
jgi:hypothetical protein